MNSPVNPVLATVLLLAASNVFMTFAWYGHLKHFALKPLYLAVFVPFAVLYMGQPLKLDYLWAGLCLVGAVYFIFRG